MSVSSMTHSDSDDESQCSLGAPPPPPHIELLKLTSCNGHHCITNVVSYLDDDGRRAASCACIYLREAVSDYGTAKQAATDGVEAGAFEEDVVEAEDKLIALDEASKAQSIAESPRRVSDFPVTDQEVVSESSDDESLEDIRRKLAAEVEAKQQRDGATWQDENEADELERLEQELLRLAEQKRKEEEEVKQKLAEMEARMEEAKLAVQTETKAESGIVEESVAKERNVLEEIDDLEDDIPERSPVVSMPSIDEDSEQVERDENISKIPNIPEMRRLQHSQQSSLETISLSEEKMDEEVVGCGGLAHDDLASISTREIKEQSDKFLSQVGRSGVDTPLSFVSSNDPASPAAMSHASSSMSTPSPTSLSVAKRLVIGGTSHLGDGRRLHLVGRARMAREATNPDTAEDAVGLMDEAKPQPQLPFSNPHHESSSGFTRLRDLHNPREENPFDEGTYRTVVDSPKPWDQNKSRLGPFEASSRMPPQPVGACDNDCRNVETIDTNTTPDVLSQLSDAALFGDTPQIVTALMSEIVDSAKNAVTHLYADGKRNEIDDSGPIKIGDKYYSHNEALQLWRKAKVKLEDQYHQVDKDGNVMMEQAPFFENNSIFQEASVIKAKQLEEDHELMKSGRKFKSKSAVRKDQGAVSIDALITRYRLLDNRSRSEGESTIVAGNELNAGKDERKDGFKKTRFLLPVAEHQEEVQAANDNYSEEESFDAANETAETESVTKSDSDAEADRFSSDNETGSEASHAIESRKRASTGDNERNAAMPSQSNDGEQKRDIDSVAGKDSLPSHMGVEVASVRGINCNFINGKSSEQIMLSGGKSVAEQSMLGSQYGTEVLFKPKRKVATARKPRTLTRHNMGVKLAKINASKQGSNATAKRNPVKAAGAKQNTPPRKSSSKKPIIPLKLKLGMKKTAKQ